MTDTDRGPRLSRRGLIKTVGVGVGGAAAVGAGVGPNPGVSPVGRSQAIPVPAVVVGGAIVYTAGVKLVDEWGTDTDDPDTSTQDALEDSLYNAGVSVSEGRSKFESEMQSNFIGPVQGESRYADTAWSEIRAAAAKKVVNGNTETEAVQAAQNALDRQTRIATNNIVQRWNSGLTAMIPHMVTDIENSVGVFSFSGRQFHGAMNGDFDAVADTTPEGSSDPILFEVPIPNLPGDENTVEDIGTPVLYGITSPDYDPSPAGNAGFFGIDAQPMATDTLQATHPDFSNQAILDATLYANVLERISNEYNSISSDLSTYVGNLVSALDQGVIDASDIYSPTDLVDQFASSDKRSRMAAELAAAGAVVPDSASWEAKISHPDLQAETLWVDLFPQFSGDSINLEPGVTLTSSDYDMAYIGYTSSVNGEYVTETLSGDGDLQILDVSGVEGAVDASDSVADTSESSGAVNLGSDPPDEIKNPGDYEDSFNIIIETANSGTFTVPVADVVQEGETTDGTATPTDGTATPTDGTATPTPTPTDSGGDYIIPDTASPLSGGETIESVRVVPVVQTTKTTQHVSDPSTVDSQQVQEMLQAQKDMVETIETLEEEANDGGGGGGFSFGADIPPEGIAVAVASIIGLGYLSNQG